jgi:pyruvate/2-oxoglutarate dehydrogenase complex dihydrolipoamide acyltransferase (E2) component
MPKWGLTMTEGKVVGWLKDEGETFKAGDELLEIETTKITNVFEAPEAGVLRRIVAPAGATLPIGGLLAWSRRNRWRTARSTFSSPALRRLNPAPTRKPIPRLLVRARLKPAGSGCAISKWAPAKGLPWC